MKVLISGYYGFGNLGDEALLSGLVKGLQEKGHRVTVLSTDPAATTRLHGVAAVHRLGAALPALLHHDALVSGGGGLLQDKSSARSLHYYLGLLRLAKLLRKRAVVYAQSVGPLSPRGEKATAKVLQGLKVAVRDEASQRLLAGLGVRAALTADAALLLEATKTSGAGAPVLLIPRAGYPDITAGLVTVARALVGAGQGVAAMAIQENEDRPCLYEMASRVPELQLWRARTPGEALAHIARARYVVSARLHGLVLAAVAHRGFSGLVYDPKVAAFLEEVGGVQHPLPLDTARLVQDVLQPRALDTLRVEGLKRRAKSGLDWLDEVLTEPL